MRVNPMLLARRFDKEVLRGGQKMPVGKLALGLTSLSQQEVTRRTKLYYNVHGTIPEPQWVSPDYSPVAIDPTSYAILAHTKGGSQLLGKGPKFFLLPN